MSNETLSLPSSNVEAGSLIPIDGNKIAAEVITNLVSTTAKAIYSKVLKKVKSKINKSEVDIGYAFEKYIKYSENKYRMVKTLLYRHESRDLYSFYECLGVRTSKKRIDTSNIQKVLELGHELIITGTGGMGKSVMMRHFFINSIKNSKFIPILVELRGLNDYKKKDIDIIDYIYEILEKLHFQLEKEYFIYGMECGCFLILLDGYDEVKNNLSPKITSEIQNMCDQYPQNYYIISSRPLQEFTGWHNFEELRCQNLDKRQAIELIQKLDYEPEVKKKFCKELNSDLFDKYKTFASNPLLLTIMLMTFETRASIPDKLNDFYDQAFVVLFHEHDATKGSYQREILSKLSYEDFKMVFSYFCFKSFFMGKYEFNKSQVLDIIEMCKVKKIINNNFKSEDFLNDLTNAVCMLVKEGLNYKFAHRSFQEYFAAVYTAQLNDCDQKIFLENWMKQKNYRLTSNYLDMLLDLEPQHFVKNIIFPGLQEIKNKYDKDGHSESWAFRSICEGISIENRFNPLTNTLSADKKCLAIMIKSNYEHLIMHYSLIASSYNFAQAQKKHEDAQNKIIKYLEENYSNELPDISYDRIRELDIWPQIKEGIQWFTDQFEFCLQYYEQLNQQYSRSTRNFNDMLQEL
ncbi:NACHT domain-containing protein [Caproicibacterium amylolyticum]|uniref:Short NACHT-associated C-terminal domain-containing protein n=1 Tax=Caproicibacterium amylolyticum TaxID=2766537 RepID=A0A7G9WF82_9FIRM|nr:hypothetical protein [Caproicibacterium amylolyticum]QNO17344.1 hypothetical protein H6X83_10370 [Caproicibacterium amylolyticum]